jgi:Gluconate 2-dehydrogenase subunit 3
VDRPASSSRRELLLRMGVGLAPLTIATDWGEISPAQARAKGVPLRVLNPSEGRTLEAFGEVLLPGARDAGIAQYVDAQLSRDAPLLFVKYMDYPASPLEFYRDGLRALERESATRHRRPFDQLPADQQTELVRAISRANPANWQGPPAPLFYFVVRNDAVDVYYGTQAGFEKLRIPYMAHITPPADW